MKTKTNITTTTTTTISILSPFSSFVVILLLLLLAAMSLSFTTISEDTFFTDIYQQVWAFKPTVPSDQIQQENQQPNNIHISEKYVFVKKWGSKGNGPGQFSGIMDIALDLSGNVYVTDAFNHNIQKFDSNGNFITKWGFNGTGEGQFSDPGDIAIDSKDNVYVAELQNLRIQVFAPKLK